MRILIVHNRYQIRSGEDAVVDAEYDLLRRHGQKVHLFLRDNRTIAELSPLRKGTLLWRTSWSRASYDALLRELDRLQPEVVHVHNILPLLTPSVYAACARRGVPVVQTLHNFRLFCPAATFFRQGAICHECVEKSLFSSVRHGCYRHSRVQTAAVAGMVRTLRRPDGPARAIQRFIVLTEWHRRRFAELGVPGDKLVVKPNFLADAPPIAREPGEYALFLGRLSVEKGVLRLADIWRHLPDLPLRIAGEGPLQEQMRDLTEDMPQVRLLGKVSSEERDGLLARARFVVVPSLWEEGLPLVILEAFSAGVPVAVSRLGALPSVARQEQGVHFDPQQSRAAAEILAEFAADARRLQQCSRAARAEFEDKYRSEVNYQRLMEIYREVAGK